MNIRLAGERKILALGPDAILGGRLFGRSVSRERHDRHGSRSWRDDGKVPGYFAIILMKIFNGIFTLDFNTGTRV